MKKYFIISVVLLMVYSMALAEELKLNALINGNTNFLVTPNNREFSLVAGANSGSHAGQDIDGWLCVDTKRGLFCFDYFNLNPNPSLLGLGFKPGNFVTLPNFTAPPQIPNKSLLKVPAGVLPPGPYKLRLGFDTSPNGQRDYNVQSSDDTFFENSAFLQIIPPDCRVMEMWKIGNMDKDNSHFKLIFTNSGDPDSFFFESNWGHVSRVSGENSVMVFYWPNGETIEAKTGHIVSGQKVYDDWSCSMFKTGTSPDIHFKAVLGEKKVCPYANTGDALVTGVYNSGGNDHIYVDFTQFPITGNKGLGVMASINGSAPVKYPVADTYPCYRVEVDVPAGALLTLSPYVIQADDTEWTPVDPLQSQYACGNGKQLCVQF